MNIFSYGGGVQSNAALVLAAQKKIPYSIFIFANVGRDSENPATLQYIEEIAKPYALQHNIELVEVERTIKGRTRTLYQHLNDPSSSSIGIPVRMGVSGAPGRRQCTSDFKVKVIDRWVRKQHFSSVMMGLGISLDEIHRMRRDPERNLAYPLIDLRMDRSACYRVIAEAGLPPPPKSSCWFCPYHSTAMWQSLREESPELFTRACELEEVLNGRRATLGKDNVYFSRKLIPLRKVTSPLHQLTFDEEQEICESGYCFL